MAIKFTLNPITNTTIIHAQCAACNELHVLEVPTDDLMRWRSGELIQDALPMLSLDARELLLSGLCGKCFDKIFG